eukprot:c15954_g1_i2.p1 GENE.c15954_g1_i2~~c15954_g1_i2.p1  ORF type:complete len:112 (+),score=34.69 c15954_g1_i2:404-739(+)
MLALFFCGGISALTNFYTKSKNRRRHLIIWNTAGLGAFVSIQCVDQFIGDYWLFEATYRCGCGVLLQEALYFTIAYVLLSTLGLICQYVYWQQGNAQRADIGAVAKHWTIT